MLIRTLKKIVKNSISVNKAENHHGFSPKSSLKSPIMRKKEELQVSAAAISRINEDIAKRRLVNDKLTKTLEEKNQFIAVMENDKTRILEALKEFYIEIIEMLKLDHSFKEDFKNLLLSSDLRQHLEEYDEMMILKTVKELLRICLDLRWRIQSLEQKDFREEEKDYVIMYRRLEIDLKKSLYNEEQLKLMNEVLKTKIEEFITHQKNLIEKTQNHLAEAKEEYLKVIDLVNNKNLEIEQLRNNKENQHSVIQSLEERLLSIVVLEYKIKNLDSESKKKLEKMRSDCDRKLENIHKVNKFMKKAPIEEASKLMQVKTMENKINEQKIKRLERENERIKNHLKAVEETSHKDLTEKDQRNDCTQQNMKTYQTKRKLKIGIPEIKLGKSMENNVYYISTRPSDANNSQILTGNLQISTKLSESHHRSTNYGLLEGSSRTKKV